MLGSATSGRARLVAEPEPEPEPEPAPEPEPEQLEAKSRGKPEPKKAARYFDSDFPYSSVLDEGAAAVRGHGEFLPGARSEELEVQAAAKWNDFYRRHAAGFFKPRNYLLHCFPELAAIDEPSAALKGTATSSSHPARTRTVLEVGCGAGDTAFSLLELNPDLQVLACDFSAAAVATTKDSPLYSKHAASGRCTAFVWDLTDENLPGEIMHLEGQMDAVVAVFVLSAIAPEKHSDVVARLVKLLRPGTGVALFRDYGRCVSDGRLI
jgi:2-polyprenyl-3-methyl-5-hydroxy-6-metoxy-1,4-benzoquinol methylase